VGLYKSTLRFAQTSAAEPRWARGPRIPQPASRASHCHIPSLGSDIGLSNEIRPKWQKEERRITTVASFVTSTRSFAPSSRRRSIAYWATTIVVVWELAVGGAWDILRIPYVVGVVVEDLGYPAYFLVILGVWKVLGAVALLAPRFPRIKEWAYAGGFFDLRSQ
jgi:hypothetical protein